MKITYTEHINKEVYLPHEAVIEVTKNKLKELLGGDYHLVDDTLYEYDDYKYERRVRIATKLDISIIQVLRVLRAL